jgi:hypothetical protein
LPNGSNNVANLPGLGTERWLESAALDMAGKIDLLERRGNSLHVVDLKLGATLNEEGNPPEEYVFQLAAYGILAKENFRSDHVVLELVSPSAKWTRQLSSELEAKIHGVLNQIRRELPKDVIIDATDLAKSGPHCWTCSFRPSCPIYRAALRQLHRHNECISPFDVIGKVVAVRIAKELADIQLTTSFSRRIVITNIPIEVASLSLAIGAQVAAYSLKTPEICGKGAHIANFHIWNQTLSPLSAFTSLMLAAE